MIELNPEYPWSHTTERIKAHVAGILEHRNKAPRRSQHVSLDYNKGHAAFIVTSGGERDVAVYVAPDTEEFWRGVASALIRTIRVDEYSETYTDPIDALTYAFRTYGVYFFIDTRA